MYGALGVLLGRESWIFFDTSGFCFVSNADISNGICVVSQFFLPCSLMIWSLAKSGVECSISLIAFLIEFLVMGTILNSSLYLIFNALNFWLVQGNEIADLIQTFREFAKYPINIFPAVFQVLFTVVIPFGFIGYYPAMYLLGKTKMCVPMWLLAVTLLFALASVLIWCCGMKNMIVQVLKRNGESVLIIQM